MLFGCTPHDDTLRVEPPPIPDPVEGAEAVPSAPPPPPRLGSDTDESSQPPLRVVSLTRIRGDSDTFELVLEATATEPRRFAVYDANADLPELVGFEQQVLDDGGEWLGFVHGIRCGTGLEPAVVLPAQTRRFRTTVERPTDQRPIRLTNTAGSVTEPIPWSEFRDAMTRPPIPARMDDEVPPEDEASDPPGGA